MGSIRGGGASRRAGLLLFAVLLGGCASDPGPTATPSRPASPTAPASAVVAATDVPPPSPSVDPDALGEGDGLEYELPSPVCPPPPGPIVVPDVLVTLVGDDAGIIASRGSTTFATCSTTSSTDVAGTPLLPALTANPGDRLLLRIQDGWSILRVEGFDAPAVGDGGNIQTPIDVPDGTDRIEVPVPRRDVDARASWTLYLIRNDRRAVGMVTVSIVVRLPPLGP